jgi:DNA polymerase-3 subunit alpha
VRERLDFELGVINTAGYAGLLPHRARLHRRRRATAAFRWARAAAARRAPSSPIRFGITDVCPLKFDLLFERFLNPERVSMPDIDVDFCFERRGEVIEYVRQRYGRKSVGRSWRSAP